MFVEMKKWYVIIFLAFSANLYSQNRIVEIFNSILPRARHFLLLKEINEKYNLYEQHMLLSTKVLVSKNGNYISFEYNKDSVTTISYQLLVFKNSNEKEILVIGNSSMINGRPDGWISFTELGGEYGGANKIYYPLVADSIFFRENNKKDYPENYFYSEYFCYTILEDNSILIKHGYHNLEDACVMENEKACDLAKNKLVQNIAFLWDSTVSNYVMTK